MGSRHILRKAIPLLLAGAVGASAGVGQSSEKNSGQASGQVFVVQSEHLGSLIPPFKPTDVKLDTAKLTPRGHRELITALTAEQGFARRPLPLDPKGLTLHANGALRPDGLDYEAMLQRKGISAKAGDRIVITDMKIEANRIVFEFNGGPDRKHKYLRHVQIGGGVGTVPLTRDDGQEPVGSRLIVMFDKYVPDMTGDQLKAVIQPVIDFNPKTPVEAYTDTLPPKLKAAILSHHVLVGMDRKMVLYALGAPGKKVREEKDGQAFEEWIYGEAPQVTQFVRFQGNRVVQVEESAVGEDLVVRNQDETGGYLGKTDTHEVSLGDAKASPNGETHTAAPSLRLPGEELPGSVQPVQQPKDTRPQPLPPPPGTPPTQLTASRASR
jgi:hypothetical protein